MKTLKILAVAVLAMAAGEPPMPKTVESWEGVFTVHDSHIAIRIRDMPVVYMWIYELASGSKGTPIGFSDEKGAVLQAATPNEKGVQPIYKDHVVSVNDDGTADIFVMYSVQGNGAMKMVEKYVYDGKTLVLKSTTMNGGKPEFEWFRQ
ncbi:MAG: hypothetical protein IT364_25190 [Candidatus Hydrogenedentes bacterium]|nr:hypothetical protein [Candidatus Hydrogenedentota bacterium]